MRRLRSLFTRLAALFIRTRRERDLAAELDSHLQLHIDDNLRAGMTPAEARRQALLALGGVEQTKELVRDARATLLDSVRQDVVFALRLARRSPVVMVAAVLSLGLGIGATAGVFVLADAALVRDLPVPRPTDLSLAVWHAGTWPRVAAWRVIRDSETAPRIGGSFSFDLSRQLAREAEPIGSVAAYGRIPPVSTMVRGEPGTAESLLVSGGYFDTLGVRAALGRLLSAADDTPGAMPAAVVSHRLWVRSFGADPGIIGSVITANGRPFTVVGVAERAFFGLKRGTWVDLYLPIVTGIAVDPDIARRKVSPLVSAQLWWLELIVRRRPGVDAAELERRLDRAFGRGIDPALLEGLPKRPTLRLREARRGTGSGRDMARPISILMALAAIVLLVAAVNVGNLLLARSSGRRQEWAMRLALGASRLRVARQHLTEGAVVGAGGGLAGLALAGPITQGLLALFSAGRDDRWFAVTFDWRLVAFAAAASLLAGLLLGAIPAVGLWRSTPPTLALANRQPCGGWRRAGVARPLVAIQIALSLTMLVASGLFVRSLGNLYAVPLGFSPDGLLLFDVDPVRAGYEGARRLELLTGIGRVLEGVPQVRMSTRSSIALVNDQAAADIIRVPGRPVDTKSVAYWLDVGPRFHETLQIPLLAGRTIGERDDAGAGRVAVVNESFVKAYLSGEAPIGQQVLMDYPQDSPPITIVGVVADAKYSTVRETTAEPVIYLPDTQRSHATATVVAARVAGDPASARAAILQAVRRAYPRLPLVRARTFGDQFAERFATERLLSVVSTAFGLAALVLAAVGLYGVMAFSVARRTAEIGIRTALGATRAALVRLVLTDSVLVIAPGVLVGVGLALAATRLIRAQLFGLSPIDPPTIAIALITVAGVALLAAYVPARRASRMDPTVALRCQ